MSHISKLHSPPPSPTSSLTYFDNQSDPMDFEPCKSLAKISETHFSPYPKRRTLFPESPQPKHPHSMLSQNRGPCDNLSNPGLSASEAMEIFVHGIRALPNDVLQSSVLKKYASTERSRLRLLLATWDIEATKHKLHTLEQIQHHLESSHSFTELEYKFWLDMYTERGLPDLKDDVMFYGNQIPSVAQEADRDATELSVMVEDAKEHGLDVDTFDDGPAASVHDEGDLEHGEGAISGE